MTDDTRQHLEFVQQIIARLNGNSFQLKTWAVTLTAGLFALSERSNPGFAALAIGPILVLWILDAYYLTLERQYRGLYQHLCQHAEDQEYSKGKRYSLELKDYAQALPALPSVRMRDVAFSKTEYWLYLPLLATIGAVVGALRVLK